MPIVPPKMKILSILAKLNFARNAVFHMIYKVCIKYFVDNYSIEVI